MADKAIFLDRDDTIIEDTGYISSAAMVKLMPTSAAALVELADRPHEIVLRFVWQEVERGELPALLGHGGFLRVRGRPVA